VRRALLVLAVTSLTSAAVLLSACGGDEQVTGAGPQTTATFVPKEGSGGADPPRVLNPQPQAGPPRAVFAEACGSCHALRAARAHGFVGPDLDELRPSAAQVRRAIATGGARNEVMPSTLRGPRAARRVARYVARGAGR
jgi:mono/diheme cytochrome c family protein